MLKKRKKFIRVIAILILAAVFLTSCAGSSDSLDINKKTIVTTICFDFKDGEIWYYLEIANTAASKKTGSSEGSGEKFLVVKGHGKTLPEVRDNVEQQMDEQLYLSGVNALVLTEEFAKKYLVEYLYRFREDASYRKKGITVITKEDPEELYKSAHQKNISAGVIIDGIVETLDKGGRSFQRTTMRLLENLSDDYTGIMIPCIGLQEGAITLTGYSVISDSTVSGFLPVEEAMGTVLLKADKPVFSYVVPYQDTNYTIELTLKKRKIKPSYENEQISYDITLEFKGELEYADKKTPYNFEDGLVKDVSAVLNKMVLDQISDAIARAQKEFGCDYLQFDDVFRVKFPTEFQNMDWQKEFPDASTSIAVKIDLSTKWNMDYGTNPVK